MQPAGKTGLSIMLEVTIDATKPTSWANELSARGMRNAIRGGGRSRLQRTDRVKTPASVARTSKVKAGFCNQPARCWASHGLLASGQSGPCLRGRPAGDAKVQNAGPSPFLP